MPTILMCPPTYFQVDYAINPWMSVDAQADPQKTQEQWDHLVHVLKTNAGAEVVTMPPAEGLPDLVFTANAAFVEGSKAIIANYKYPERQPEEALCEQWFNENGYQVIRLPEGLYFEGAGDALIWKHPETGERVVFAGYRTRTDIAAHNAITSHTGLPVLSLELVDPRFYHVDVCICPLDTGEFIYYPGAFDEYGLTVIETHIPEQYRIPVSAEEAAHFACNAVNVGNTVVFHNQAPQLTETLRNRGLNVVPVDLSEFLKSGGSSKCLTLRIKP